MVFWNVRETLSEKNKIKRSYYEILRDKLDNTLIEYGLVDSYLKFKEKNTPYPFVEKRELKPRAIIPKKEYKDHNSFLVILEEEMISDLYKKNIRYFDFNKTIKKNLETIVSIPFLNSFNENMKYLDSANFLPFIRELLPIDYALLIQRDSRYIKKNKYAISHFHVRIDWTIADAAEKLAKDLRYISQDLYEQGDKYSEDLQKKLFEYHGMPFMAGGRRTAAVCCAQLLKQTPSLSTTYVSSSESRAVFKISERGVFKNVLLLLKEEELKKIALENSTQDNQITINDIYKYYCIDKIGKNGVATLQVSYVYTSHSKPPEDGKLRMLKADANWLSVERQQILPKKGSKSKTPLLVNIVYN